MKLLCIICFFLPILFGNELKLSKNCFTFRQKHCLCLTHSALQYFENLTFSKTRTNSQSKHRFFERSFNFPQNSVTFCALYSRGGLLSLQSPVHLLATRWIQRFKRYVKRLPWDPVSFKYEYFPRNILYQKLFKCQGMLL